MMTSNYRAVRAAHGFNYATTNMNYALGCDLNQSLKYVGLCDDAELANPLITGRVLPVIPRPSILLPRILTVLPKAGKYTTTDKLCYYDI